LRQIGGVPEALKIEADEYLFTLAAVLPMSDFAANRFLLSHT